MNPSSVKLKMKLNLISICLSVCALVVVLLTQFTNLGKENHTLNMSNTIFPVLASIANNTCYPNGADYEQTGQSSSIIYKKEPAKSCIGGTGNYLYARCYIAKWNGFELTYLPTKDVPLPENNFSCIDESKISIPYYDERLAKAEIGTAYLAVDHSKL